MAKLMLHPAGLKPHVGNWDLFANYFVHSLQQELRSNPYAIATRTLLDGIMDYPDLPNPTLDSGNAPVLPFLTMELILDDTSINLFSMVSTFGHPHDVTLQQLRIETFLPTDESSEKFIRDLSSTDT